MDTVAYYWLINLSTLTLGMVSSIRTSLSRGEKLLCLSFSLPQVHILKAWLQISRLALAKSVAHTFCAKISPCSASRYINGDPALPSTGCILAQQSLQPADSWEDQQYSWPSRSYSLCKRCDPGISYIEFSG